MLATEASAHERTDEGPTFRSAGYRSRTRVVTRRGSCSHLAFIVDAGWQSPIFCEECLVAGTGWSSLRVCLSCGHVGCVEGSSGGHAAQHYAETDHPIAAAIGSHPATRWCYPHGRLV
jgi:uncharacterized membrane protein